MRIKTSYLHTYLLTYITLAAPMVLIYYSMDAYAFSSFILV